MNSTAKQNWSVFVGATLLCIGVAMFWLAGVELTDENIRTPIRHTAQLAFALYLIVLVARPLQQIFRREWSAVLLRKRRHIGVAFAGVMTAHLALIAYRFGSQPELEYPLSGLIVGGGAYALFYLMFITSFDGPKKAMHFKAWKVLHRTGLIWAAVIFGLPRNLEHAASWDYWKFGIPFWIAVSIRVIAWLLSRRPDSRHSPA